MLGSSEAMETPIPSIDRLWFPVGPGLVTLNRSCWPAPTDAGAPSMAKLRKTTLDVSAWASANPAAPTNSDPESRNAAPTRSAPDHARMPTSYDRLDGPRAGRYGIAGEGDAQFMRGPNRRRGGRL